MNVAEHLVLKFRPIGLVSFPKSSDGVIWSREAYERSDGSAYKGNIKVIW